jgi:hypothetical protein
VKGAGAGGELDDFHGRKLRAPRRRPYQYARSDGLNRENADFS